MKISDFRVCIVNQSSWTSSIVQSFWYIILMNFCWGTTVEKTRASNSSTSYWTCDTVGSIYFSFDLTRYYNKTMYYNMKSVLLYLVPHQWSFHPVECVILIFCGIIDEYRISDLISLIIVKILSLISNRYGKDCDRGADYEPEQNERDELNKVAKCAIPSSRDLFVFE